MILCERHGLAVAVPYMLTYQITVVTLHLIRLAVRLAFQFRLPPDVQCEIDWSLRTYQDGIYEGQWPRRLSVSPLESLI